MSNWFFDERWIGEHGIGRFAFEVNRRINFHPLKLKLNPASALDVFFFSVWMLLHPKAFVYSPGFNSPFFGLKRCVITVHDLNHIDFEMNSSFLKRVYYNLILKRTCRNAARVLTVSNFTAQRISEWAGISLTKIRVVGNGVSESFFPDGKKHIEDASYFLVVGNRKEHKNNARTIQAFAKVSNQINSSLIFNGAPTDDLIALVANLNLNGRVKFVGRLDEKELAEYYRGAVALIFVSLYEGFGLPVIEAMACGTPVITSSTTSLPEISASAAIHVNPLEVSEISDAMRNISSDINLRKKLIAQGLKHQKKYSWDLVAKKVESELLEIGII